MDKFRINFLTDTLNYINREIIVEKTANDEFLKRIEKFVREGWPDIPMKKVSRDKELQPFFVRRFDISSEDGILYFEHRVIIPEVLHKRCLEELHRTHQGVLKMKAVARSHFWWPKIDEEIETLTNNCKICCENRKNPPLTTLHKWKYPEKPGERIHADFGHFGGKTFLLITDQFSKWLELYWMTSTTAEKTISCFRQYFSTWGLVQLLVTDNGPPFSSQEFKKFLASNGVKHLTSAVEHPRSNGAAEVMVGTVKNKLKKILLSGVSFEEAVSSFLLDYRTTIHQTTGKTPAELQLNRKIATRFDVILKRNFANEKKYYPGKREVQLQPEDRVLIRQYRKPEKWIEGVVVQPVGEVMAEVSSVEGIQRRHADQLIQLPNSPNLGENGENPEVNEEVQAEQVLRRSERPKKKATRLIEEI